MSARDDQAATVPRRAAARRTSNSVSPLPPPEEVFADWLMSVPHDADLETAARLQMELIDGRIHLDPDIQCLRMLLAAVAGEGSWKQHAKNL